MWHTLEEILSIATTMQLVSKSTYFVTIDMLVLCVIVVANPCSHICDYKKGWIIFLLWMQLWLMTSEVFVENTNEKWQYIIQFWLHPLNNDIIIVFATIMVIFATTRIKLPCIQRNISHMHLANFVNWIEVLYIHSMYLLMGPFCNYS